ncbi:MAG: hypothetical protein R3E65_07050 [Steroidobacteraceae bacterium]
MIDQALVELRNTGVRDWLPPDVLALTNDAGRTTAQSRRRAGLRAPPAA